MHIDLCKGTSGAGKAFGVVPSISVDRSKMSCGTLKLSLCVYTLAQDKESCLNIVESTLPS